MFAETREKSKNDAYGVASIHVKVLTSRSLPAVEAKVTVDTTLQPFFGTTRRVFGI